MTQDPHGPSAARIEDVDLELIDYPDEYQRDPTERRAKAYAQDFDPDACGALTVARRGQRFVIVDGNHRLGALRILGVRSWPCVVVELSVQREAALFVKVNSERSRPNSMQIWKARLAAGDPVALDVMAVCDAVGVTVGGGDHNAQAYKTRSVVAMEKSYRTGGAELLRDVLMVATRACPPAARHLDSRVILGLTSFLVYYEDDGRLDLARAVQKFSAKPVEAFLQRAAVLGTRVSSGGSTSTAIGGPSSDPGFVRALVEAYNVRLKDENRLTEPTPSGWKRVSLARAAKAAQP